MYDNCTLELYLYQPDVLLKASINGVLPRGTREIPFDTVTQGSINNVIVGSTIEVSGVGSYNKTVRLRVKGKGTDTIIVPENSVIWNDNSPLEVQRIIEPWSVAPRIDVIQDVPLFYKDYDVAYVDQNQVLEPIVNAGPNRAGRVGSSFVFNGSDSWDANGGSIVSGSWSFEGGTPSSALVWNSGIAVTFDVPGPHLASMLLVNNAGKTFRGYRHIVIGDPERLWSISSISGDRSKGFTAFDATVTNPSVHIRPGTIVVLNAIDSYSDNPFFTGYVVGRTIKWNSSTDTWTFKVEGLGGYADRLDVYGASTRYRLTSNHWFWWKVYKQTVDKAALLWLRWHTTILSLTDFYPTGDTRYIEAGDLPRGGVLSGLRALYSTALRAEVNTDRKGAIRAEMNWTVLPYADRPVGPTYTVPQPYASEPQINDSMFPSTSDAEVGGMYRAESGTVKDSDAFLSSVPGDAPEQFGRPQQFEGLALPSNSQAYLNEMAGHLYAWESRTLSDVSLPLKGNYRNLDIAPLTWYLASLQKDDLVWNNKRTLPTAVNFVYNARQKTLQTTLSVAPEVLGYPGVTKIIPPIEPVDQPLPPAPLPPAIVPPVLVGNAKEIWLMAHVPSGPAGTRGVVWTGDAFVDATNAPTWNLIPLPATYRTSSMLGFYRYNTFGIANDGSALFLRGFDTAASNRIALWKLDNILDIRANPSLSGSPNWVKLIDYGMDALSGYTLNAVTTNSQTNSHFIVRAKNYQELCNGWDGYNYHTLVIKYDGVGLSIFKHLEPAHSGFELPGVSADAWYDGDAEDRIRIIKRIDNSSTIELYDSGAGGDNSPWMWNKPGSVAHVITPYTKVVGGVSTAYLRDWATHVDVVSPLHSGAASRDDFVGGAWVGPQMYCVESVNGQAYKTEDGSTWTPFADWESGNLHDTKLTGGGNLVWIRVLSTYDVAARLYDRNGGIIKDLTGNLWNLLATCQLWGSGLVYYE